MVDDWAPIFIKGSIPFTRVILASEGGNQYLTADFLHGGSFGSIDDWVKNPQKSPGAKRPKNAFFKMAAWISAKLTKSIF